MNIYYLYLKTHNITGLKYLGKHYGKNPYTYQGSGQYWKRHIRKYGYDVTTDILLETTDPEEIKKAGILYSEKWDIVNSDQFANLTAETGTGGSTTTGKIIINNGVNEKRLAVGESLPPGWIIGRVPMKKNNPNRKKAWTPEKRQAQRERNLGTGGWKHKPESIEKMKNKEWTQKALDTRRQNCIKAAEARKGSKWSEEHHANRFIAYLKKNKHLFPQVLELHDAGINNRQISIKLGISWDRVKYMIVNRDRINSNIT
jgi:hypothetical protein